MNTKLPQISYVYDRRKIASPTRKSSVEMRISHNYKQKYINTGIKLYPNQWKNGRIINCPDIHQISQILDKLLCNVRQILCNMMEDENINIALIGEKLKELSDERLTFISYCEQRAAIRKFGKKKDTQERYGRFLRMFRYWGKITEFGDVNENSIIEYDRFLSSKGMRNYSKWNNYHRFLNSFIIDAQNEGLLKRNPYKWVNIIKDKNTKSITKHLSPEEFSKLKYACMPSLSIERVRDLFIFQTYTCLSYSDLKNFDSKMIQEVKGVNVYIGIRKKTSRTFTIPLLTPALDILHKYNGVLPVISNVKYNQYLKVVAQASGIDKPVSTHWARHTGATLLLNEGVPMQVVSKICGHSSTRITEQVYANLLDETVVDAVANIEI